MDLFITPLTRRGVIAHADFSRPHVRNAEERLLEQSLCPSEAGGHRVSAKCGKCSDRDLTPEQCYI